MKKVLVVFGTRPEAIKLAPLIKEMQNFPDDFDVGVCVTGQHREMLDQVLSFFDIKSDYDLNLMRENQSLSALTSELTKEIDVIFEKFNPDYVVVQGDTSSAFLGALTAFYRKIKIIYFYNFLKQHITLLEGILFLFLLKYLTKQLPFLHSHFHFEDKNSIL